MRNSIGRNGLPDRNAAPACDPLAGPDRDMEQELVRTVAELFYDALRHELPDALACKEQGAYRGFSHGEVQERVERAALALVARGLRPGDRVGILAENSPAWAMMDYACAVSGLVSVPIYHTLTPDQVAYILEDSGCRWVCVSSPSLLGKMREALESLSDLECVLLFQGTHRDLEDKPVLTWAELLSEGEAMDARRPEVRAWAEARRPEELLTLIYTSGTTGDPKGAMLTQGNLASNVVATVEAEVDSLQPRRGDRCLSILPLSHIFERMAGHYTMFHLGIAIYYAESLISLPQNLLEVRPQIMSAVPRIFEKIYSRVRDVATGGGFLRRLVFGWAVDTCHRVVRHLYLDRRPPLMLRIPWRLADRLILSQVREKTGGRLRFSISGGAPLNPRVMEFFWAMGIPIYEGYGLTETSPVLAVTRRGKVKPGFVGSPVMKTWEDKPFLKIAEDGEILVHGPNVMAGYWRQEAATREAFDAEGYFHTGDIGEIDPQGRVKITDRKKEIIVTSGGKNVAPQPIENLLRADKYIEQAVLIGDKRPYITALVVPNFPMIRHWCRTRHLAFGSDAEMVAHPKVYAKLMTRVERVNAGLPNYERVRRVALLDQELTMEAGFLTPSLKVKRRVVNEVHAAVIASLYREQAQG